MPSVLWFRRDLRLQDHPALSAAAAAGSGSVLGLFVIDPTLWSSAGPARQAWLAASLRALDVSLGGRLVVRVGDPAVVVPAVAREIGAAQVHVTNEVTRFGRARDRRVVAALDAVGVAGVASGTPYAVEPGSVRTGSGTAYQVFTPFRKAWYAHGWPAPLPAPEVTWVGLDASSKVDSMLDAALRGAPAGMPEAGEAAAWQRWTEFRSASLEDYAMARDLPAVDGTSRLSSYLRLGVVHPRQLLAELAGSGDAAASGASGAETYVTELAWREFYADVLHHRPDSAWADLKPVPGLTYDDHEDAVEAWRTGTTGYPIVDAGMRQLLHEGWMHNRVRMITASFLTKDLHVWWPVGARHFLDHLTDGDLASNNHGWQWVAGTGTDASPYFRVFNPITQGKKFDPSGDYVRRWVPELAHLPGKAAHEPWTHPAGYRASYPLRIVDHAAEREEALRRYQVGR